MIDGKRIGIIGAGVIGLSCADTLTDAGYAVTIVARDQPGDETLTWASPWAGACVLPDRLTEDDGTQLASFKYYWQLAEQQPESGVQIVDVFEYFDDVLLDPTGGLWRQRLLPGYRRMTASEFPDGVKSGFSYKSTTINPLIFLPWLKKQLCDKGVQFIRAEVKSIEEAQRITKAATIVNASGLGALQLAQDDQVHPVRGQTMLVKSNFDRVVIRKGSEYTYTIPRLGSGVIIGGIEEEGSTDVKVNAEIKDDIFERINRMTSGAISSTNVQVMKNIVGFRPGRNGGYRLEMEGSHIVHAYGFRGSGYLYSRGVAEKVRDMVVSSNSSRSSKKQEMIKAKL